MTTNDAPANKPLWLSMEEMILGLADQDLTADRRESTARRLASELDAAGFNVSHHAGHMLELRAALDERSAAGRPMLKDFNSAVSALQIDDVVNPRIAAAKLALDVGGAFPLLRSLDRRKDVQRIVEQTRLDLFVAKARELGGEPGVRYLIAAGVAVDVIIASLGITREDYGQVEARIAAERAERSRVVGLLDAVAEEPEAARIKHLIDNNVTDELILEVAQVPASAIADVRKAMEKELAEKKRLADEAAAKKAAEAAGPSLDSIASDDMLEYIEGIREILGFSSVEAEIRTMCAQSNIPQCLVDIAVSEPDKLDELETKAGG